MFEWFEVRSLVLLKIQVFWDVTPCRLVNGYRLEPPKKWLWRCCNDLTDMWRYFMYWYFPSEFYFFFYRKEFNHGTYRLFHFRYKAEFRHGKLPDKSSISDHTLWENCAVRIASGRTGRQFDAAADWHTSQRLSLVTLMCIKLTFLSHNQDCAGFPWILYRFFFPSHTLSTEQLGYGLSVQTVLEPVQYSLQWASLALFRW